MSTIDGVPAVDDLQSKLQDVDYPAVWESAQRWNALINCARMMGLGWAGFDPKGPSRVHGDTGYRHMGIEFYMGANFWTQTPKDEKPDLDDSETRQRLTEFADVMRKLQGETIPEVIDYHKAFNQLVSAMRERMRLSIDKPEDRPVYHALQSLLSKNVTQYELRLPLIENLPTTNNENKDDN